jgi:diguanylate cyclase (GGDEF)-like protein
VKKGRKKESGRSVPDEVAALLTDRLVPVPLAETTMQKIETVETVDDGGAVGSPRSVETMLKEISGGEAAGPDRRPGGSPSGKYDHLWQLSMADPHTGLANQLLLLDRLTQALARRQRHGGEVAVCHIDLDNLGEINLDLGYTTGNTVLCEGARRLTSILRAEDSVGRVGGSELVVVVAIDDAEDVSPLVRRLQQTLDEPVLVGGQRVRMHARLGLALAEAGEKAEDVLIRADRSTPISHR